MYGGGYGGGSYGNGGGWPSKGKKFHDYSFQPESRGKYGAPPPPAHQHQQYYDPNAPIPHNPDSRGKYGAPPPPAHQHQQYYDPNAAPHDNPVAYSYMMNLNTSKHSTINKGKDPFTGKSTKGTTSSVCCNKVKLSPCKGSMILLRIPLSPSLLPPTSPPPPPLLPPPSLLLPSPPS